MVIWHNHGGRGSIPTFEDKYIYIYNYIYIYLFFTIAFRWASSQLINLMEVKIL